MAKKDSLDQEIEEKVSIDIETFAFSEYTMFLPRGGNSLRNDYKELNKEPIFKPLTNNELIFCWLHGHEASPFFEYENQRVKNMLCYQYAFEKIECKTGKPVKELIIQGNFPPKIREAVSRMNKYKMAPRVLALKVMERTLQNINKLSLTDMNGPEFYKDGEIDFTKKNNFMNAISKGVEMMPVIIDRMENGLSVDTVKALKDKNGADDYNFMDDLHDQPD